MEKAYNDIDLEKLDEDLDINAEGLMEELSELLLKELAGDLDGLAEDVEGTSSGSASTGEDSGEDAREIEENDPTTDELPFEQCSSDDCASSADEIAEGDDKHTEETIIEATSSEEVSRAIAASVLRYV